MQVTGSRQPRQKMGESEEGFGNIPPCKRANEITIGSPSDANLRVKSLKMGADHFNCTICLDLVYKPVVHACGHIFCFWCVHHTMNSFAESHCPLCRRAFTHFPRICEQLHFFLSKALPKEYSQRAEDIQDEEERKGYCSPVLAEVPVQNNSLAVPQFEGSQQLEHMVSEVEGMEGIYEQSSLGPTSMCELLCKRCSKLLYKPVVLNCGHAFCHMCITYSESSRPSCPICQNSHPNPSVLVCLELDQYLETAFPVEHSTRQQEVHQQEMESSYRRDLPSSQAGQSVSKAGFDGESSCTGIVHVGVGCDGCGMMPIIGRRFRCKDCLESIGFDLCSGCYQGGSYPIGRFNQRHSNEHRVEEVVPRFGMVFPGLFENPLAIPNLQLDDIEFLDREVSGREDENVGNQTSIVLSVDGVRNDQLM